MGSPTLPPHLRSTLLYLVTVVGSQLGSFVLLPIVTRFLSPAVYGEYVLVLAVVTLIGMIGSSWIRNVGLRFYFDAQADGTTRAFYLSMVGLQAVVLVVAVTAGTLLLPLFAAGFVRLPTLLAGAFMILASDFQALTQSFVRAEKRSAHFALAESGAVATRLVGTTLGLYAGFTQPSFLFLAAAAGSVLGGVLALRALLPRLTGPAKVDRGIMRRVFERAPSALPYSVGQWLSRLSDRIVLSVYSSSAVVGVYAAGFALADRIIGGLVEAVFMMAWPDVLSSWNDGGVEKARVAVRRYFQIFLWMTVGPLAALVVFGSPVVALLLDVAYRDAAQPLALIAFAAWILGVRRGLNRHFELQKRYTPLSLLTGAGALLNLSLNLLLIPKYQAVGAGLAAVLTQIVMTAIYVAIRDRRLVWFAWSDAAVAGGATSVLAAGTFLTLGPTVAGFLVFAGAYAAVTIAVWTVRVRRGWAAEG